MAGDVSIAGLALVAGRWAALTCMPPVTIRLVRAPHVSHLRFTRARLVCRAARCFPSFPSFHRPLLVFRIVHTRWGDAHPDQRHRLADPALRLTATWQAPLTVKSGCTPACGRWAMRCSSGRTHGRSTDRRPLANAPYIYLLLRLADIIGRNRTEKLLIVGLMATLGTMQLLATRRTTRWPRASCSSSGWH